MDTKEYIRALRHYVYTNSLYVTKDMLSEEQLALLGDDFFVEHGEDKGGENEKQIFECIRNDELIEAGIKEHIELFLTYLPDDASKKFKKTTFAVLNTLKPEAYATKLSEENYIVIISFRLCKIFHYYTQSKYIIGQNDKTDVKTLVGEMIEKITESFTDEFVLFPKQTSKLNEQSRVMAMLECLALEFFVILHEYAHIFLGHLDNPNSSALTHEESQIMELEADIQAITWINNVRDICADDTFLKQILLLGSAFVSEALFVLGIMERAKIEKDNTYLNTTHPSVLTRLLLILLTCREKLKEPIGGRYDTLNSSLINAIISALKTLTGISDIEIEELIDNAEQIFTQKL
jgi:cell fate (sporulation/competence/biofilm development) regulator YmcA (YheA/YmcA/DUF963 family)